MKRALKITFVLIIIAALVLGILWLVARHHAEKTGSMPPTFREFFSLPTKSPSPTQTTPSELPGDFTSDGDTTDTTTTGGIGGINGAFTNGTIIPGAGSGVSVSGGIVPGFGGVGSGTGTSGNGITPISYQPVSLDNNCSEADTHIAFTADELSELNDLSTQFYSIAQNLHSDADVASAQAAYDSFKIQDDQLTELNTYCANHIAAITDPQLKRRVATPFWNDTSMVKTFFNGDPTLEGTGNGGGVGTYYSVSDEAYNETRPNVANASTALERFLRLSLW